MCPDSRVSRGLLLAVLVVAACSGAGLADKSKEAKPLWQPFYITPRCGSQHQCLNKGWRLGYRDEPVQNFSELKDIKEWSPADLPASVHWALYRAGKLPYPYAHLHSLQYDWIEEKPWYYRKTFDVPASAAGQYAFLCCDGIDYYARFWLNGKLVGRHEGMSGGPAIEVSEQLQIGKQNELVIEVRCANAVDPVFKKQNPRASNRTIKGWKLCGGTGAEPWFSMGVWQGVRLELMPKVHMERPFLVTRSASEQQARVSLGIEVLAKTHSLRYSLRASSIHSLWKTARPWNAKPVVGKYKLQVELLDAPQGKCCFKTELPLGLFEGRNWVEKDLVIDKPRLWWPNGMGKPELYHVVLRLLHEGKELDRLELDHGIRTIERVPSAGPRTQDRWTDWQFIINGRRLFVKGCNWMPADVLLDLSPERYRWLLESARDAGIQILRIWGGGLVETDDFFDLCDELGIMVWEEFPIGNRVTPDWPQDVWEAQVIWNIFRLRSRPSLAVWCGGNEFNPYVEGNSATIGILERAMAQFDNTRAFFRASPDEGSIHTYPDMDPCWYSRLYRLVPYVSETGMHSIPEARSLYEIVNPKEFKNLGQLWDKSFKKSHPEFLHHFVEYNPARVPRMLSRASHVDNMNDPSLESLAEASQIGAGEFYQVFSQAMQANYPVTAGLMPWVFKRPWPVVSGIMLVDGFGQPSAPYYFLKRTYEPTHVAVTLPHLLWAPGESIPITGKVIHASTAARSDLVLSVRVLDDGFGELWQQQATVQVPPGPSVTSASLGDFTIPKSMADRFLFVVAELCDKDGQLISRSVYWPRSLTMMAEAAEREKWRTAPRAWPYFKTGPWLKPTVAKSKTALHAQLLSCTQRDDETTVRLRVRNQGAVPAFPVILNVDGIKRLFRSSDNFFWLAPKQDRELTVVIKPREESPEAAVRVTVEAWNASRQQLPVASREQRRQ